MHDNNGVLLVEQTACGKARSLEARELSDVSVGSEVGNMD